MFYTDDDIVMDNRINFFDSSLDISENNTMELLKDGLILKSTACLFLAKKKAAILQPFLKSISG